MLETPKDWETSPRFAQRPVRVGQLLVSAVARPDVAVWDRFGCEGIAFEGLVHPFFP